MKTEMTTPYAFERELVADFARFLSFGAAPWGTLEVGFEFDYGGGSADVFAVAPGREVLAFEAKLTRWRDALHQAYRTRCFARRSYVVLPERVALIALRYAHEFERRDVGLCSVRRDHGIQVLLDTEARTPLQPWVAERALAALESAGEVPAECPQTTSSKKSRSRSVPRAA
jgi:hypothetical protein